MARLEAILVLTAGYFSTIIFEMSFKSGKESSTSKATLFEHIQSSLILTMIIGGLVLIVLSLKLLMVMRGHGKYVVYVILLKFFELIPILIDLINLLFICQQNSFNRLYFSLIFTLIRLFISLDLIRRKCNYQWKRQILVVIDFLLFILVSTCLLRDSSRNPIRITRKIILGALIFQLNNLFYIGKNERNISGRIESLYLHITHVMLFLRWVLSSLIICVFIYFTISNAFASYIPIIGLCTIIVYILYRDTVQNQKVLKEYGLRRKSKATCSVCFDEKESNQFDPLVTATCKHPIRTICEDCLLSHVQQAIQITFTDDICCPELECRVRFDYSTVKYILSFAGDKKLLDRYDQYVTHQQLERMEEFIWCSNPECNAGQLNEGGSSNNIVTCYVCRQKTCFTHRVQWHEDRTCEQYDLEIDPDYESSRRWIVENSKKCPNCPFQIEKNDGCDHMTCTKCRHEFCWACLADFQSIRTHGNHRHKDTCKHYAPYNDE